MTKAEHEVKFVSRCVPKAKNTEKGNRQHNADIRTPQVRFVDSGGSRTFEQIAPPMLKVRGTTIIDGKKYRVIS